MPTTGTDPLRDHYGLASYYVEPMGDGLVVVNRIGHGSGRRPHGIWVRAKVRKEHNCRVCHRIIAKGELAYRPINDTLYRYERICAEPCIDPIFPNGRQCPICEAIERSMLFAECCDGPTDFVRITDCALGSACEHDDHHYGHHVHIEEMHPKQG